MLNVSSLAESLPLTLVAGGAVAALAWFLLLAPDARHRALRALPCPPSTLPVLGNTLDLMHWQLPRLHDWILEQCLLHGGKTWRLQALGAPPLVVVSSVACFEDVLKTQFEVFDKGERMNSIFRDIMGDGIFAVDGDKWRHQRKALVHLFTMRQFRDTICGAIETHLLQLGKMLRDAAVAGKNAPSGELFPLGDAFQRYAFDTFTEIAFGFDEQSLARVLNTDKANESEDARATDAFFEAITELLVLTELRFHQPDWLWQLKRALNVGAERQLHNAIQAIDRKVYAVIERTLQDHQQRDAQQPQGAPEKQDVVGLIMEHIDDFQHAAEDAGDQLQLSKFLRDVGLAMLAAGKDTTGTTLQWCMVMFARAPRVVDEIRKELRAELPRLFTDDAFVPPMDAVEPRLVYLEACLREALRLCPPGPLNAKEANRDTTLCDGTFLKRGTRIYLPSYALARMPAVWGDDAAEFKPERWIDPETGKLRSVSSFQFVSFHAGPRICVGMRFALVQLKTTLAYLLSNFDFALEKDPHAYKYQMAITYALEGSLRARVAHYPPVGGA